MCMGHQISQKLLLCLISLESQVHDSHTI
uniref:Uncharacterized protein n=1 Tax=Rhizophora mucronata TaxID=61149 RepID=A0A2P2QCN6_RHIMU